MESLNLQVVAVLMPLEIKRHTVSHLKALTRSIEHRGGHGHGSTFKQRYTVMKSTILLHKCSKLRFHVMVAVASKPRNTFCIRPLRILITALIQMLYFSYKLHCYNIKLKKAKPLNEMQLFDRKFCF